VNPYGSLSETGKANSGCCDSPFMAFGIFDRKFQKEM
jgi:hypothetical protein